MMPLKENNFGKRYSVQEIIQTKPNFESWLDEIILKRA